MEEQSKSIYKLENLMKTEEMETEIEVDLEVKMIDNQEEDIEDKSEEIIG